MIDFPLSSSWLAFIFKLLGWFWFNPGGLFSWTGWSAVSISSGSGKVSVLSTTGSSTWVSDTVSSTVGSVLFSISSTTGVCSTRGFFSSVITFLFHQESFPQDHFKTVIKFFGKSHTCFKVQSQTNPFHIFNNKFSFLFTTGSNSASFTWAATSWFSWLAALSSGSPLFVVSHVAASGLLII